MLESVQGNPSPAISKIRDAIFNVTFDPWEKEGKVIVNVSYVNSDDVERVLEIYKLVDRLNISISPYIKILDEAADNKVGIMTICSITIDGILLKHGISINPVGGGVLYVEAARGVRFTDFLKYESTTIDPLETLTGMGLTSVTDVIKTGSGKILANIREAPMIVKSDVERLLEKIAHSGLNGVLEVGEPNRDLFDIPMERDHFGIVIAGGINPLVAAAETGIRVENHAISGIVEISEMERISDV